MVTKKETTLWGVHKMPADLKKSLMSNRAAQAIWEDITPLARNEWICWVISGKRAETRNIRIKKTISKLKSGMRRPCCWTGCIHRTL
ncbi:MAG TPA: YdeI/OmpD-associated family protein [Candidatus Paceibacterota bacterium]